MSQFFASGGQNIGLSASAFNSILAIKLEPPTQKQTHRHEYLISGETVVCFH